MKRTDSPARPQPPALSFLLHQANMRIATIALLVLGASIVLLGLVALRAYMIDNLSLSAHNIAYTVEAAVVFNDSEAANEALSQMAGNHLLASAQVIDRDGNEIARWQEKPDNAGIAIERLLAGLLLSRPAVEDIRHNGQHIGQVKLYASGQNLLIFLLSSLACGLISLLLCRFIASRLSHQASRAIVAPLQHLAEIASRARRERQFGQRVAPQQIAELQSLGDDFNALLAELESWRQQMQSDNEQLDFKANHDPLTGLANRAQFENRLASAFLHAKEKDERLALFFIDADRFKSINDKLGHEAGDAVLCAIAARLRATVRESDLVARLGGDEFAVLLPHLGDPAQAARIAGNILDSMAEPIELSSGAELRTSLSIGIALYPDHAGDAAGLLKSADDAMYQSKRAGRGAYALAGRQGAALLKENA